MGNIVAVQFLADPNVGLLGRYDGSVAQAKSRLGYLPYHDRCWDVPMWAVPVLQHMRTPVFKLIDHPLPLPASVSVVVGSVMACNCQRWRDMVDLNPDVSFVLGGYGKPNWESCHNVVWCNSLSDGLYLLARAQGEPAPIYHNRYCPRIGPVFNGVRVQLSVGCLHRCDFCTVPGRGYPPIARPLWEVLGDVCGVYGPVGVVYLDDKTFGQCDNWRMLSRVRDHLAPTGFVVQTTAHQAIHSDLREWARMGVIAVEIGVESYNNAVLQRYHKPTTERIIDRAVDAIAEAGMKICPNIIVGMQGETHDSYEKTLAFMNAVNDGCLGWFNIYCLADYSGVESDRNEASPLKTWQSVHERQIAKFGFELVYRNAIEIMEATV